MKQRTWRVGFFNRGCHDLRMPSIALYRQQWLTSIRRFPLLYEHDNEANLYNCPVYSSQKEGFDNRWNGMQMCPRDPPSHCSLAVFCRCVPSCCHVNRFMLFHLRVDCVVLISLQKQNRKTTKKLLKKKNVQLLCVPACEWMCHFITKQYTVQRSIFFSVQEITGSSIQLDPCATMLNTHLIIWFLSWSGPNRLSHIGLSQWLHNIRQFGNQGDEKGLNCFLTAVVPVCIANDPICSASLLTLIQWCCVLLLMCLNDGGVSYSDPHSAWNCIITLASV